jgi:hypothetical protein
MIHLGYQDQYEGIKIIMMLFEEYEMLLEYTKVCL